MVSISIFQHKVEI